MSRAYAIERDKEGEDVANDEVEEEAESEGFAKPGQIENDSQREDHKVFN